jgi:hypothetical protein
VALDAVGVGTNGMTDEVADFTAAAINGSH